MFRRGRHEWCGLGPDLRRCAEQYFSTHLPTSRPFAATSSELMTKGTVAAAWGPQPTAQVKVTLDQLDDAVADLESPAFVVVENVDGDGGFIKALTRIFGRSRIATALERGWLEIVHGGGQTTFEVCLRHVGRFRLEPRVVLLLDSDRLFPTQRTANHDKAEQAAKEQVKVHVLELREAENYLPNRLLACVGRGTESSRRLTALKTLIPAQRGYYDMKHGLHKTAKTGSAKTAPAEHKALYEALPEPTAQALSSGFGSHVLVDCLVHAGSVQIQDFDKLGVTQELRHLLDLIDSVI
jgi:hypothetical protein